MQIHIPATISETQSLIKISSALFIFLDEPRAEGLKNLEGHVPDIGLASASAVATDLDEVSAIKSILNNSKSMKDWSEGLENLKIEKSK